MVVAVVLRMNFSVEISGISSCKKNSRSMCNVYSVRYIIQHVVVRIIWYSFLVILQLSPYLGIMKIRLNSGLNQKFFYRIQCVLIGTAI